MPNSGWQSCLVGNHLFKLIQKFRRQRQITNRRHQIIYNTLPWMTTHKEYASLKSCQGKIQWDKNQWRRKKSIVFL